MHDREIGRGDGDGYGSEKGYCALLLSISTFL